MGPRQVGKSTVVKQELQFIALKCSTGVNLPMRLFFFLRKKVTVVAIEVKSNAEKNTKGLSELEISSNRNRHLSWVMVVLAPQSSFLWI